MKRRNYHSARMREIAKTRAIERRQAQIFTAEETKLARNDNFTPHMKAFCSWQGRYYVYGEQTRALPQMLHHWKQLTDGEKNKIKEMLILPPPRFMWEQN